MQPNEDATFAHEAWILHGTVHVLTDPRAVRGGLHVVVGDLPVPLVPADPLAGEFFAESFEFTEGPQSVPDLPFDADVEGSDAHVVRLVDGDWALPGETTAMVVFDRADGPGAPSFQVPVTSPLRLPPRSDRPLRLNALVAAHRAVTALVVQLTPPDGGAPVERIVPVDPGRIGGRVPDAFQRVEIDLGPEAQGHSVTLAMRFDRWTEGADRSFGAVGFIARARVVEVSDEAAPVEPARRHAFVAPVISGSARSPGHRWFRAALPDDGPAASAAILLRGAGAGLEIARIPEASVQILRDEGHTLVLQSDRSIEVLACFNRTPAMRIAMNPGETHLRIPTAWLTGEPTLFKLRDLSDSFTLFRTVILPPRSLTPAEVMVRESRAPFPAGMFAASTYRFAALRAHARAPIDGIEPQQLALALDALEAGYDRVKLRPLSFPVVEKPQVSVVIPAHNKVNVTYSCLCALLLAWNRASFEVILVDDASTDETAAIEELVSGITVVRNTEPQRFIRACNAGAARARGDYIVLLNNDTEPTTGWLDNLVDAFSRFPGVGLAGSKLLFPDGRLQDAGGIIWGSGNPWNYGSRQNPWEPRFSYARQADYLSGAALMVPRKVWDHVGGLSSYLEPMYFEDTDLSFKVRDAGYTTWFIPSSVVFHHEGMTSGTDTASGFKRFQEVNRPKFKRRWARAFAGFGEQGRMPDREKDRGIVGRVLFVDYTTPRADQDAGSYAALQEIRMVQALGYKVTFLPENLAHFGDYTTELERQGVEVIVAPFFLSVDEYLDRHAAEFDALYVTRYHVANNVVPRFRSRNSRAKVLMNNADLHFLRVLRSAHADGDVERMAAADQIREQEIAAMRSVDLVLSYNDVEHAVIQSHTRAEVRVTRCPWVVDIPPAPSPRDGRAGLSFLGGFRHFPNVDGVLWMAREVMPLVADALPGAVLSIYGSGMGPDIRALKGPAVRPVGFVEDVAAAFDPHLVFVAPLLSGAGIKGKVLAAMAHGIPCVLSPVAAEGIGLRHGYDCLICRTPQDWAEAITLLHKDPKLWQALCDNARAYMRDCFSFEKGVEEMRAAFELVDMYGA